MLSLITVAFFYNLHLRVAIYGEVFFFDALFIHYDV